MISEAEQKKAVKAFKKAVFSPKATLKALREDYDALFGNPILPNNTDIEEIAALDVPCDIITPEFAVEGFAILYAHGGGFVSGSRFAYRNFCASLAHETGCRLVLPEYKLSPEYPYPAALEDIAHVFAWAKENLAAANSIILSGDGAGGNLALSLVHSQKAKEEELPAALILFSPWVDLSDVPRKKDKKSVDPVFTQEALNWQALQYTLSSNLQNPGISPIFGDFEDFPPLYIQCGANELLAEDARRLAEKAAKCDVNVSIEVFENMWHFFQGFDKVAAEATTAVKNAGAWARALQKKAKKAKK